MYCAIFIMGAKVHYIVDVWINFFYKSFIRSETLIKSKIKISCTEKILIFAKKKIMTANIILGVIGPWQVGIIIVVILLMFGGKKIPELMKGMGQGINEFKKGLNEGDEKDKEKDKKE